jgi:tetratricopeptide (TPR) repeat protein
MTLNGQLAALETAGLIALARADPDLEYLFRHALIQDAAYDSLLKSERSRLHQAAGEALEKLYPDQLDELAPRLAEHFWQAGEPARALPYYVTAAQAAAGGYANAEAIDLYTLALRAAEADPPGRIGILQARGALYDLVGDFDRSRADQEAALAAARDLSDPAAEWQSLVNLGFLWASRDYQKTGDFYRQAIDLARRLGDQRMLAHSLNWLGNFQINTDDPLGSRENHAEALRIFEELGDEPGVAETTDLLGMSNYLGGNLIEGARILERAKATYERIGDRRGMSGVLGTRSLTGAEFQADTMVNPQLPIDDAMRMAREGLRLAEEIGWRSGEVYSLACLSFCQISYGDYDGASETTGRAIRIAEEIRHRQWEIIARTASAGLNREIYNLPAARRLFERALDLGVEIHSNHWIHTVTGLLGACLVAQGDLDAARELLADRQPVEMPADTMGQRLVWCARAELAVRSGHPADALAIVDRLAASAHNLTPGKLLIRPWVIRGEALTILARASADPDERARTLDRAEQTLQDVLNEVQRVNNRTRLWRIYLLLADIHAAQGRAAEAGLDRQRARQSALGLAENISDRALRAQFLERALPSA